MALRRNWTGVKPCFIAEQRARDRAAPALPFSATGGGDERRQAEAVELGGSSHGKRVVLFFRAMVGGGIRGDEDDDCSEDDGQSDHGSAARAAALSARAAWPVVPSTQARGRGRSREIMVGGERARVDRCGAIGLRPRPRTRRCVGRCVHRVRRWGSWCRRLGRRGEFCPGSRGFRQLR